jgi:Tfp pilus assembly protein PilX
VKTNLENSEKPSTVYYLLSTDRGVALVAALVITLAVSVLVIGTLYVVTQSTMMSGAGKRYATASEAADGSIEVMKASIRLIASGEPVTSLPIVDADPACLADAVLSRDNQPCATTLTLPGNDLFVSYSAKITLTRLYVSALPGNRLEFPRSGGGPSSTAIYYRINAIVTGPGGARAETTALYRYVS